MFWLPLAGAALGAIQGENKRIAEQKMNMAEAAKTQYSPWTGMQGQIRRSGAGMLSGAIQGGLTGAMLGQSMGLGGTGAEGIGLMTEKAGQQSLGANALGSSQMSSELGQIGQGLSMPVTTAPTGVNPSTLSAYSANSLTMPEMNPFATKRQMPGLGFKSY